MKYVSKAPTRIGLIGGGTDINPFASQYGGKVLSLAINLIHTVTLTPWIDSTIEVSALGEQRTFNLGNKLIYGEDKKFDLVRSVINEFSSYFPSGFSLDIQFSGLSTSGLGTSSSACIAMLDVFATWLNRPMSKYEMALKAWVLENDELGWPGGKQDQLAAAFGGINLLYFGPGDKIGIEPLSLTYEVINQLQAWSLVLFIKQVRNSGDIQKTLIQDMGYFMRQKALFALRDSVDEALRYINLGDWYSLGKVLDEVWVNKKACNPAATNETIDYIYNTAIKHGALGGKVMGAGGGGHMYFLCPPEKQAEVIKALDDSVKFETFTFDFQGVRVKQEV